MLDVAISVVSVLVRVAIGLWGHSGQGCPPMFGDFEAQRHWLEVTTALPIGEWYKHTDRNDLQYWGLDYPPLTAYVSYFFGRIASVVLPGLVEPDLSRGYEQVDGRIFMRATVLVCDMLLLIPVSRQLCAVMCKYVVKTSHQDSAEGWPMYLLSCLLLPGLLLIDHGHFQYNGVCLALALYAILLASEDKYILGSVFFCLSLNFKQMSL